MNKLFGTDGVRGVANELLTPELSFKLGYYSGKVIKDSSKENTVLIGRDTRYSGDMLKSALAAGFMTAGVDVIDLGIVPTPCVAYLLKTGNYLGGAVISASHNPYQDNGIKIFDGQGLKLNDEEEDQIEALIFENKKDEPLIGDELGREIHNIDLVSEYTDYLKSIIDKDLNGLKVAIDVGNGALYEMGENVLRDLGAEVFAVNTSPDGTNINKNCGSTNPDIVSKLVLETGADVGLSFDGDADRLIATDEKGEIINGDHLMAIFARYMASRDALKNSTIVGTSMTNMGLDTYLKTLGLEIVKTAVGDRYVLEEMLTKDYSLGGEQSGHIIFLDYNTTGDGLATALHLLNILNKDIMTASELNGLVEDFPQVLLNAKVDNSKKYSYMEDEEIVEKINLIEEAFQDTGRVVIRPSGTEPLVRVMIEGQDKNKIDDSARELKDLIEKKLGR